ncbi:MAG: c-type cytochrome [Cyclobacteriaceae bacterium]
MIYQYGQFSILGVLLLAFVALSINNIQPQERPKQSNISITNQDNSISGDQLMVELGCNNCHLGISSENLLTTRAPDLSHAASRYNPAYIFSYLQNPQKVRHHIGASRMPDFMLSDEEALALTLFLTEQNSDHVQSFKFPEFDGITNWFGWGDDEDHGKKLFIESNCNSCHTINGEGNLLVSDLSKAGVKLQTSWLKKFLAAPSLFSNDHMGMPSVFYKMNNDSSALNEVNPDAVEDINDLVAYLASLDMSKNELDEGYDQFKKTNLEITSVLGEKIYKSQNCAACHVSNVAGLGKNGPNLAIEGSRVKPEWLMGFLKQPHAVRPNGYLVGSGSRMPNFNLTDREIEAIAGFLLEQKIQLADFQEDQLSAFSQSKAHALLQDKLSCVGCHQIGRTGGRIGPDLSGLSTRLTTEYIGQMISSPHQLEPLTGMPSLPLPLKTKNLIVNYLVQLDSGSGGSEYIDLIENPPYFYEQTNNSSDNYLKYCASCHGEKGDGKGYNAAFMSDAPTAHNDAKYMSDRPDDTLFDGVHSGGLILDKSNMMPAWGNTLQPDQIKGLVMYMRELCDCSGPDWAKK